MTRQQKTMLFAVEYSLLDAADRPRFSRLVKDLAALDSRARRGKTGLREASPNNDLQAGRALRGKFGTLP
jgi:hypothetical protein